MRQAVAHGGCGRRERRFGRATALAATVVLGGTAVASVAAAQGTAATAETALRLEAPAGPGSLRLVNTGSTPIRVAGAIAVEWKDTVAGTWQPQTTEFNVVERCQRPYALSAAPAVRLGPGMAVTVVPWRGYSCSGQCNMTCRANIGYGPGVFRPVVTVLPTGQRVPGPEWLLGAQAPGQ